MTEKQKYKKRKELPPRHEIYDIDHTTIRTNEFNVSWKIIHRTRQKDGSISETSANMLGGFYIDKHDPIFMITVAELLLAEAKKLLPDPLKD
ncbi:MAG: hypothetical protein KJI71_01305 [Patescibacteria group bacterium]|nr:hypothetical protein [Patescibacteria group bacterium]